MKIAYDLLLKETIDAITQHKIWVLATSADDLVTARSMSFVNDGLSMFFQTHRSYIKYRQIEKNTNVALCRNNIQIEAEAIVRGNAFNGQNDPFLELYQREHPGSYHQYTKLDGQIVVEIQPRKVTFWKYIDNVPYKDILDIVNAQAVREEQLHLP